MFVLRWRDVRRNAPDRLRTHRRGIRLGDQASVHRSPRSDRPELLDAVLADPGVPVVEVDGWVAMAGARRILSPGPRRFDGTGDAEPPILVGAARLASRASSPNAAGHGVYRTSMELRREAYR